MTTIVLGAGVIGVTTAYYLARDGHKVVVIDRQSAAGLETSFANGGLVTPSMSDPWAAPGVPAMIVRYLGREEAPFLVRLRAVPAMAGWGLRFLRNCAPERWRENTEAVVRLGLYSRDALDQLIGETGIAHDRCIRGNLRVYREPVDLAKAARTAAMYRDLGVPAEVLDGPACVRVEPALGPVGQQLAGGIHYRADRSGDCLAFTQALAQRAADLGVEFRYDSAISELVTTGDRVTAARTGRGDIAGERFVLACGSYSAPLARRIGLKLPVQPVKGYSATLPVGGWNNAPVMPIVDYHRKIAATPMGGRIRLAGTAEFAGFDSRPNPRRGAMLVRAFRELFPDYPGGGEAQHWHGLRPMCSDGRPILGPSRYGNLFLNTGHGPLGWTLACGSARLTAALMAGRKPDIPVEGFALTRF